VGRGGVTSSEINTDLIWSWHIEFTDAPTAFIKYKIYYVNHNVNNTIMDYGGNVYLLFIDIYINGFINSLKY